MGRNKNITEENFILELKNKNEKALEYVIDNYAWILKTVIARHLFYLEDRQFECMNDCLLGIWENIEYFNPEKSSFKNWIAGIAKYKSIDYLRKYLRDRENLDIEEIGLSSEEDVLEKVLEQEFNGYIYELLESLNPEDRKIFIETYFKDRSADEISDLLDLEKPVIYNRLSRGRKKLKKEILEGKKYES